MKKRNAIIGLLLVILVAGNGCHNIRHNRNEMRNSAKIERMGQNFRHYREMQGMPGRMAQGMRPGMMGGMGPGMGMMRGMGRRGMMPGMGMGMMRGFGRVPMDSTGWMPMGPGRMMMESIPNVTENQKKQITDLIKKHQDEMKKLREEMSSKFQSLIESNRKDMLNILTDEQKKFIESERGKSTPNPEKEK